jgi:hypothetical protein
MWSPEFLASNCPTAGRRRDAAADSGIAIRVGKEQVSFEGKKETRKLSRGFE